MPNGTKAGTKTAGAYKVWSEEEDRQLLDATRERAIRGDHAWHVVSEDFPGRSMEAVRQRYLNLRNASAGIERDRHPQPRKVKTRRERTMPAEKIAIAKPPEYTSLTAAIFGDPRPGRSALDQKRSAAS